MFKKTKTALGVAAVSKARELQELIDFLNSTDVGSLNYSIQVNAGKISAIKLSIDTLENDSGLISNKLNSIASALGITFNEDGTINEELYSSHTHSYEDEGAMDTVTKNTQGVD